MLTMIKEIEGKILDQIIAEAKSPEDESIKAQIAEWKSMKKKLAVVEKMAKAISDRIEGLEKGFGEMLDEVDGNKAVVDGAILEYTQKKGNTSVKYKEVVDYTLKLVNEQQRAVIEMFMATVTKSGDIKNVLTITDPEFAKYLIDLKSAGGEDMMAKIEKQARTGFDRLPKQVMNDQKKLKEGVGENIAKVVKNLVSKFRTVFAGVFKALAKSKKAAEALQKAVKADPLKESLAEGVASVRVEPQSGEDRAKFLKACEDRDIKVIDEKDKDDCVVVELPPEGSATAVLMSYARKLGSKFKVVEGKELAEAVGINKGIRSIVASIKSIDMESDSDSLDAQSLRDIMVALKDKWDEPGVPGSDQSSDAKMILKVGKMLDDLIKALPKREEQA